MVDGAAGLRSQWHGGLHSGCHAPIVEQIHGELGDKVKVVKMDIDENPSVPMQLGIMSIPTVIIFKDGKPAERTVGYRPNMKGDLKAKLEALI